MTLEGPQMLSCGDIPLSYGVITGPAKEIGAPHSQRQDSARVPAKYIFDLTSGTIPHDDTHVVGACKDLPLATNGSKDLRGMAT